MRRITVWLMSTLAALVLLFAYRTSTGAGAAAAAQPDAPAGSPSTVPPTDQASPGGTTTRVPTDASATYQGAVVQTRYGLVQVTVTITDDEITNVVVPDHPGGNARSERINAYALPVLDQEALAAQCASIHTVSGATFTSDGYRRSLQSALDAHPVMRADEVARRSA